MNRNQITNHVFHFRPEIVIIDLTIPWDDRVEAARSDKSAKFSKLVGTIKANDAFNVTYQSLEIGSYRQRLSEGSESAIKLLYNYILPKISYYAFRSNLINLVNYTSYEVRKPSKKLNFSKKIDYYYFQIFSSRSDAKWELNIYPVPLTIEEPPETNDQVDLATVTELVEKLSESSEDETFLIKDIQPEELPPMVQTLNPIEEEDLKFSVYQLLAILLIFCLLLFTLNVMWNHFYTTLFVCLVSFPILRKFGKI